MISVDPAAPTPPFEQIRRQIAAAARSGALPAGRRLPSIRQLAGDLRIAPGTVARAYKELEGDGIIVASRGGGTRVLPGQAVDGALAEAAARFAVEVRAAGADLEDALAALRAAWGAPAAAESERAAAG